MIIIIIIILYINTCVFPNLNGITTGFLSLSAQEALPDLGDAASSHKEPFAVPDLG